MLVSCFPSCGQGVHGTTITEKKNCRLVACVACVATAIIMIIIIIIIFGLCYSIYSSTTIILYYIILVGERLVLLAERCRPIRPQRQQLEAPMARGCAESSVCSASPRAALVDGYHTPATRTGRDERSSSSSSRSCTINTTVDWTLPGCCLYHPYK